MNALLQIAHVGLWVAVVAEGLAICVLFYKNSQLEVAAARGVIGHHPVGTTAPYFHAKDVRTGSVVSNGQFMGSQTVLLFITPSCPDCRRLMRGLAVASGEGMKLDGLVAFCGGSGPECADAYTEDLRELEAVPVLVEHDARVVDLFGIRAAPVLVELDYAWHVVRYSYPSEPEDVMRTILQDGVALQNGVADGRR